MSDDFELVPVTDLEAVSEEETTDQTEGQEVEEEQAEEEPEKKRETAKERRERDKALKARLREEREEALQKAADADARRLRILDAGKAEAAPKEDDFTDYSDFIAAKAVWAYEQKSVVRDAGAASEQAEAERKRASEIAAHESRIVDDHWQAQVEEAKSRYADFEEVALKARPGLMITPQMADMIKVSDVAADLAYHIASRPDLSRTIAAMPPLEAARAIGRIEAQISAPKAKTVTDAAEPIKPVRAGSSASKSPADMTPAEYRAWRASGGVPG